MPYSQARNKATQKYIKNNYRRMRLDLNKNTEQEMIDFLESQPNVNAYLKELIKKDMGK